MASTSGKSKSTFSCAQNLCQALLVTQGRGRDAPCTNLHFNNFPRFELFSGSQLHIDMDDSWQNISHHRVTFKKYDKMLKDPISDTTFKSWPKPLTIEFLEEQFQQWTMDLTSLCWDTAEVRELGGAGVDEHGGEGSVDGDLKDEML